MNKYSAFRNPHSAIGNKGFTLIEIIVLVVMAGIIIPVIVVPFATGDANYPGQNEIVYVNSNFSTPSGDVGYKRIRVRVTDPEANTYEVYSVVTNFP